jgi:hypothetical protein
MMEAIRTSETSVYFHETTRRYVQERCRHTRRRENLKLTLSLCSSLNMGDQFSQPYRQHYSLANSLTQWYQNLKVHNHIKKSPPQVPILRQLNPLYTLQPTSLKYNTNQILLNTFTGHKSNAFRPKCWPSSVVKNTNTSIYGSTNVFSYN